MTDPDIYWATRLRMGGEEADATRIELEQELADHKLVVEHFARKTRITYDAFRAAGFPRRWSSKVAGNYFFDQLSFTPRVPYPAASEPDE